VASQATIYIAEGVQLCPGGIGRRRHIVQTPRAALMQPVEEGLDLSPVSAKVPASRRLRENRDITAVGVALHGGLVNNSTQKPCCFILIKKYVGHKRALLLVHNEQFFLPLLD